LQLPSSLGHSNLMASLIAEVVCWVGDGDGFDRLRAA
jgi:hypothetical protein